MARKVKENATEDKRVWTMDEALDEVNERLNDVNNVVNKTVSTLMNLNRNDVNQDQMFAMSNELRAGIYVSEDDRSQFSKIVLGKIVSSLRMLGFNVPEKELHED
jgi:DNA-binding ferritin-like protein